MALFGNRASADGEKAGLGNEITLDLPGRGAHREAASRVTGPHTKDASATRRSRR